VRFRDVVISPEHLTEVRYAALLHDFGKVGVRENVLGSFLLGLLTGLGIGGNVVAVLGPKWRIHYLAHLSTTDVHVFELLKKGEMLGRVGTSGNAAGKSPHLHYAVLSLLPRFWKVTTATQGWKRMFFVDPGEVIGI
jgi:murein DD-endopeptidase MepM/ murein hydrolase activator NlpD